MKNPKRAFLRIFLAAVLIAAAAVGSYLIKQTIDSTDPDSNLPLIEATVGYTQLDVRRSDYQWFYFTRTVYGPSLSYAEGDIPLYPLDVMGGAPLVIVMSDSSYISMNVARADGLYSNDFLEVYGTPVVPTTPGVYVYRIFVGYRHGNETFYTAVRVTDPAGN